MKKHKTIKHWQQFLGLLVVFVSFSTITQAFAATSAVVANGTHATHLIQNYLKTHPVEMIVIKQTQNNTVRQLDQLQQLSQQKLTDKVETDMPQAARLPMIYPIRSQLLNPGKVVSRSIQVSLPQPFFIVGNDALSKQWLTRYQHRLSVLNAKGFVVNVKSQHAMQALQAQFPELPMMALPGDQLAKWLKLKHYPVLISDTLIEQ